MISLNPSSFAARLSLLLGAWLFAFSMAGFAQPNSSLTEKVKELANKHEGKVAVYIKHLESGEVTQLNADTPMPTASLIKFAIMVAAYKQVEAGKANLSTMVTLKKDDKVPGSGILTKNFSEGASFPLKDAIRLMIAYSDNTATNLVLDQVGMATVNQIIESLGYPNTKINAKVFKGYHLSGTGAHQGIRPWLHHGKRNRGTSGECLSGKSCQPGILQGCFGTSQTMRRQGYVAPPPSRGYSPCPKNRCGVGCENSRRNHLFQGWPNRHLRTYHRQQG